MKSKVKIFFEFNDVKIYFDIYKDQETHMSFKPYSKKGNSLNSAPGTIIAQRDPTSSDIISPTGAPFTPGQVWFNEVSSALFDYAGSGTWNQGGNALATTTVPGIVLINTSTTMAGATDGNVPTSLAIKTYADNLVIAGAPVATETTAGIGQLATDAEAVAGTPSTGLLALFVTPSNLTPVFAAPPAIGGTTPAAAAFTNISATGVGTGNILTSDTASNFSTTGAGIDVTVDSAAGRVIINGEEAAANAITLLSAAGGIDADAALQINIATSQSAVDAIRIVASAGGIDIDAVGAAGEDINITNTGASVVVVATESAADAIVINATLGGIDILASGAAAGEDIDIVATGSSVNITSTENNAGAILITENGGASGRITLNAAQGTGADSINLDSTAGGITLAAALATADAINLAASAGGVDIDGALQVNIASSQNAVDAIRIVASAGGIDIDAVGAATEDINITNTGGSVVIVATESAADAIRMNASGAAGGFDIDAGTNGFIVDTTGGISLDSAAASNFTATGAFDITIQSTAGSILLNAGEAVSDAINIDSTGGFDLDAALQINITSSQAAAANSIRIFASAADGGIDIDGGTGGITVDSTGAVSVQAAAASDFSVSGAGIDLSLVSAAGRVVVNGEEAAADAVRVLSAAGGLDVDVALQMSLVSSQNAADAIVVNASAGGIDITAAGAAAEDIDIVCTAGSINLTAGENIATSMVFTNTGMDIATTGAAGQDIDVTNTGGSINLTATENVSDAIVINASGAASGMTLDCGTASLTIGTGIKHAVTSTNTAATPYAVLGTDYFITTDTTGGAMTVTLPAVPGTGRTVVVYDGAGQAAAGGNVTIDGNGNNIAAAGTSAATKLINTAYESYILTFNGTLWCGQNIV